MIYEKILKEKLRLEKLIKHLQSQIEELPAGKLICASNRKWQKWYISDGHTSTYLPKKERSIPYHKNYNNGKVNPIPEMITIPNI